MSVRVSCGFLSWWKQRYIVQCCLLFCGMQSQSWYLNDLLPHQTSPGFISVFYHWCDRSCFLPYTQQWSNAMIFIFCWSLNAYDCAHKTTQRVLSLVALSWRGTRSVVLGAGTPCYWKCCRDACAPFLDAATCRLSLTRVGQDRLLSAFALLKLENVMLTGSILA